MTSQTDIFPFLRYADASAAIEWLGEAFGFEPHLVVPGPDGSVVHGQLRLGAGMIMLSSAGADSLSMADPGDLPGQSQGIYIAVDAIDEHYQRARAAGAEILREIADQEYGSRDYTARDPEGYVWSFGTYRPGQEGEAE